VTAALEIRDMGIRFGGLVALEGVNVDVPEWEIVGLIGPNGAGKTTLFNCITGLYTPNSGTVKYRGRDISLLPTHRRVALGLGRTFQNIGLVRELTVLENFLVAQHPRIGYGVFGGVLGAPRSFAEERRLRANALEVLDFLELAHLKDSKLDGLPYGTLNLTVLMIEHHVPLVTGVCDYVYVLNFGRILTEGKPQQVQSHPEVIAAYLGGEVEETQEEEEAADAAAGG
jgi:branched-chain amino acid transport system ATP-binding protein